MIFILYLLILGLICLALLSLRQGFNLTEITKMMLNGSKKSFIVLKIFVLIGAITAVWRACGTISFIVYYGISFISAKYFILSAFILCSAVSFLLGTSFGTVGTMGVVLIVLAKTGSINVNVAAGAIIAGAYFGDRCSPMSSSANLIASLTGTNLYVNITNMFNSALIPFLLSIVGYIYLSQQHPLTNFDNQIGTEILNSFNLSIIVLFPAVIILLMAILKYDVKLSMGVSILSGILIGIFVQNIPAWIMLKYIATGYKMQSASFFAGIIQGGGLLSMLNVSLIVLISCAYSGIFEETGLLTKIEHFFKRLSCKTGIYSNIILTSLVTASLSCNQTLAVILTHQFQNKIYRENQISNNILALDMENTVILLSALIPWNIAGAVPAATLSADPSYVLYAFYLFLVPLTYFFTRKHSISVQ